jgi:uncharacterized protein YqhQ
MANKNEKPKCVSVGGQAVMEGVMMQGPQKVALAVRKPDGKVALKIEPVKKLSDKYPVLGWPIIRGVVNFVAQLASGMKMLMASAEMAGMDEEEPSEFDKKVAKILHMKAEDVMMVYAVALSIVMVIGLFFVVPTAVEALLNEELPKLTEVIPGLLQAPRYEGVESVDGGKVNLNITMFVKNKSKTAAFRRLNREIKLLFDSKGIVIK